jgi:cellulose synthase operon protein C
MLLHFPTLDVLRLALSTGAIPAEVAAAPVEAHTADDDSIVVEAALPTASVKALQALGAVKVRTSALPRTTLPNWLALLPLARREPALGDKTPVVFELESGPRLAEVVAEILRLGNDRQSFRHLTSGESNRTLLRVLGPPYYTLLRALDTETRDTESRNDNPRPLMAFVEQVPRVWVQLGYEHPLADRLEVPPGKWLFVRPLRAWEWIDEGAFQDIYGALEFPLPAVDSAWHDQPLSEQIAVPLRLTSMAETDPAELWVLSHNATQQIEQLVGASDNELIARLAFAVVQKNEPAASEVSPPPERIPLVLLRVRPSKLPPPVLVLDGVACRSYLNLPNLFVPVGRRLHPPLRRDVVTRLLAADSGRLVWLEPGSAGQFHPRSIPDGAFRPLSAWVDYVLDQQHEPLAAWTAAHQFDFAGFVCREEEQPRDRPPRKAERPTDPRPASSPAPSTQASTTLEDELIFAEVVEKELVPPVELARAVPQPSELQQRLSAAENQFLAIDGPLDSPERALLWREMAHLNGALDRRLDASLCWSQVLWEQPAAHRDAAVTWLGHLGENGSGLRAAATDKLRALAEGGLPERLELTQLAAQLVRQATDNSKQPENHFSPEQLSIAGQVLARHEQILPIRIAWLAWVAIAELSHGDTLALARARDRLLERLFQQGLTAEHDLPGFLRAGSGADADRQRVLGERLRSLRDEVVEWIHEPPSPLAQTRRYAELVFAYGLARLGETAEAERIVGLGPAADEPAGQRPCLGAPGVRAANRRSGCGDARRAAQPGTALDHGVDGPQ